MNASKFPPKPRPAKRAKPSLRRRLATSQRRLARLLRWAYHSIHNFSVPAPKIVVRPLLWLFLLARNAYYFALRVFICEPLSRPIAHSMGGTCIPAAHLHWITGKGDIVIGDNVTVTGKIVIGFATRFSDRPTLRIGDNTGIGGGCGFTIGKLIEIGRNCNLSGDIQIMDSNGHDTDPALRWKHEAPARKTFVRSSFATKCGSAGNALSFPA